MSNANKAMREFLQANFTALPYLEITNANPKSSDRPANGFVAFEHVGGHEEQVGMGNPGANPYREQGVGQIHVFTPVGKGPDPAEGYAEEIRALFRGRKIAIPGTPERTIHIGGIDPPIENDGDSRYFGATIAFEYWYDNFA